NENVTSVIENQRDMYKYIHDQALNLINQGYTMDEISHMVTLPDSLKKYGYTHEFYGTVQMGVKAVYQKYLGFYDGNPTHLYNPEPTEFAATLVEYMGGADAVIPKLKEDYAAGKYEETATIAGYLVFADPTNYEARYIQADALEQLGYQSVSGPYRNAYLSAAQDLRATQETNDAFLYSSVKNTLGSPDVMKALSFEQVYQSLAIRLNSTKAEGVNLSILISLTSDDENWNGRVQVKNSVLHAWNNVSDVSCDAVISGDKDTFVTYLTDGELSLEGVEEIAKVSGDKDAVSVFLGLFDTFHPTFNIITP
ncbi:MAG: alkyl sulfatase dimerization domain-containing protein, partial [Methanocorpusculum sp.]|nr:alkyl sulfatase dimerization domain-containing protein [Methanocorpusculum sp.]